MTNRKKPNKTAKMTLDSFSESPGRGRPRKCRYEEVIGRGENYKTILNQIWQKLSSPLLAATNEKEVTEAFAAHGKPFIEHFVPKLAKDILRIMRERKFPKRAKAQINFLAYSLAGRPSIGPRTSRDICASAIAEAKTRSPYKIIRKEFYVECSCGFQGPAQNDACRKCGAKIHETAGMLWGVGIA